MRLPSKKTTFWILMALSAVSALLVPGWTSGIRRFTQTLHLVQGAATELAHDAEDAVVPPAAPQLSAAEIAALQNENEELRRQVAQQQMQLIEAERRIKELTGLADQLPDSGREVVIAPVLGYDTDPRRATLQIMLRGDVYQAVEVGQWVLAGAPQPEGADARVALDRQYLIGRVIHVAPHVATVQLVTDRGFPRTPVQLAAVQPDHTWRLAEEKCLMAGTGREMRIDQATANYFKDGYQVVVAVPDRYLPVPLTIGLLTGARARTDSSQHFDLTAVPCGPLDRLSYVYVLSLRSAAEAGAP